jgi:carbon-monoxide dehydrogenase small subunit
MADITLRVNGATREGSPEARKTLADFLREDLDLTGTHVGCEHGVCGACTVIVDGRAVRSCLMLAVQAAGSEVTTIEGLAPDGGLGPLQQAMWDSHSFQCGFCTPGFVMQATAFLATTPTPASSRSAKRYPATSAGAPATRASSMASCWPPSETASAEAGRPWQKSWLSATPAPASSARKTRAS